MSKRRVYRLNVLVSELQLSETDEYKKTVLCLINCLILGSEDIWARHSMRCELIIAGFLDVIDAFRTSTDPELMIQVEVFDQNRMSDDDLLDLTEEKSLHDLFTLFLQKVNILAYKKLNEKVSELDSVCAI